MEKKNGRKVNSVCIKCKGRATGFGYLHMDVRVGSGLANL